MRVCTTPTTRSAYGIIVYCVMYRCIFAYTRNRRALHNHRVYLGLKGSVESPLKRVYARHLRVDCAFKIRRLLWASQKSNLSILCIKRKHTTKFTDN